ncbi:Caffeoyl-CoA O-methyltransferase [[Leptolyngbya] sp. PCC 7376]|uniref:class I SAM-dependent methyltransferase n=1 Tax=[Leptolyngbya] sp. PCC 7376 TaxID=111781 RepID=UPI00029EC438|nr:class I SAM-dependent methyltransferase [[Leptolyngbya] sp. PCC 7376]AFY39821.1 Caffeoyl-CoA O-methyltransferase [[Leptolyngbya] sp. PCC 7376]
MNKTLNLTPELYQYLLDNSLREHPVLTELRQFTATQRAANMQISPDQGQFMIWLLQLMGAKKTLDIGVFTGYSSLVAALAMPEDGKVVACDRNPDCTKIAREYWQKAGVAHKIELRLADALDTLDKLIANGEAGTFDFSFIDADKRNYINYFEKSLTLLRTGGVIAIDNVLWSGRVADPDDDDKRTPVIHEFNEALHHDKRVDLSLLAIADGLTLARKL